MAAFDVRLKFEAFTGEQKSHKRPGRNLCRTRQTLRRDIINMLLSVKKCVSIAKVMFWSISIDYCNLEGRFYCAFKSGFLIVQPYREIGGYFLVDISKKRGSKRTKTYGTQERHKMILVIMLQNNVTYCSFSAQWPLAACVQLVLKKAKKVLVTTGK